MAFPVTIAHKDMVQVLCSRYGINASEASSFAKEDREVLEFCGPAVRNAQEYHEYLDYLEKLGAEVEHSR